MLAWVRLESLLSIETPLSTPRRNNSREGKIVELERMILVLYDKSDHFLETWSYPPVREVEYCTTHSCVFWKCCDVVLLYFGETRVELVQRAPLEVDWWHPPPTAWSHICAHSIQSAKLNSHKTLLGHLGINWEFSNKCRKTRQHHSGENRHLRAQWVRASHRGKRKHRIHNSLQHNEIASPS